MVSAKQTMANFGFLATLDPLSSLKKKRKKKPAVQHSLLFLYLLEVNSLMTASFSGIQQQPTLNKVSPFHTGLAS